MALIHSSLSQVCKGIRSHLDDRINNPAGGLSRVAVVLAAPADTAGHASDEHRLNLFFFRFEPAGLFPDTLPGQTGWLRSFCLMTPFAVDEDEVGAGENDLRLVGDVVRIFHEQPVLALPVDGQDYHVQVIFQPLALDQLNQLWSTQGDTVYRPSLLYEISLAPVLPVRPAVAARLAGSAGLAVALTPDAPATGIRAQAPTVPRMEPAIARNDWVPALAFVDAGRCAFSLQRGLSTLTGPDAKVQVWLAGKPGATLTLRWQTWDADHGWQERSAQEVTVVHAHIDPEHVPTADLLTLDLPASDRSGQLLLHGERSDAGPGASAVPKLRSNPLLISLFRD